MPTRKRVSLAAFVAIALVLPAMAAPVARPWPEAHSGAYLGVQIAAVTQQRAAALKLQEAVGAIIVYVDQDGPACKAGLLANDVVVAFDGSRIEAPDQLQGMIHATPPQKTVTLTIVRGGQRKDVKVTLGSWNVMSHARAFNGGALAAPPPPRAYLPDVEVPSFTALSQRHGLVVESLSPQLADFFGVPRGHGVLVRSVEGGSPAAASGMKAGDIILKVNNEVVHDMADWQRGMRAPAGKIPVTVWRDKHEQTVVINLPGSDDSSRLEPGDWLDFENQLQTMRGQMAAMRPEIEHQRQAMVAHLGPSQKELEQMRRELEKSMTLRQKDIDKMSKEIAKAAKPTQKDVEQLRQQIQQSMPSEKDWAEMQEHIRESMPTQQQFDEMQRQLQASIPSQKELDEMREQIQSSMKNWTPQLQHEMEQLKKQMEQQKLDLQQMMRDFNNRDEF
jgi:serine protease Do